MVVLVTCKKNEDPAKYESIRVLTIFLPLKVYGDFSRRSRAANSVVPCWILMNFEPVVMVVLLPVRMKKIQSKMEDLEFPHYIPMGPICCHGNQRSDPISPKTTCSLSHPNDSPDEI